MRKFSLVLAIVASLMIAGVTVAAPAAKSLKTFGNGDVVATANSATIVNGSGEYGGVYLQSKSQSGKLLANVTFMFTNRGDVAGGAPRFSLPINDGTADVGYAFLDAAGCGAPFGPGTGDDTLVSTQNPACHVNFKSVDYANWTTFASSNPTFKTASGYIPFIIADAAGSYNVTDIVLR